jgi:hypothetical protein
MAKKIKPNKTDINKKKLLTALEKSLGVVTLACKSANLDRSQFYVWLKEDEAFAEAVEDMNNIALDFAESSLHKQIQGGVPSSTIFYLKTRGKNRGYIERTEVTGADGAPLIESEQDRISRIAALKEKLNG